MKMCRIQGCNDPIDENKVMCSLHWLMVPKGLQIDISNSFSAGEESKEWTDAVGRAISLITTGGRS